MHGSFVLKVSVVWKVNSFQSSLACYCTEPEGVSPWCPKAITTASTEPSSAQRSLHSVPWPLSSYPLVDFPKPTWKGVPPLFFLLFPWRKFKSEFGIQRLQLFRTVIMPKEAMLGYLGWEDGRHIGHIGHMTYVNCGADVLGSHPYDVWKNLPKNPSACQGTSTCRACFSNAQGHRIEFGTCFCYPSCGKDHILSPFKGTFRVRCFSFFPMGYLLVLSTLTGQRRRSESAIFCPKLSRTSRTSRSWTLLQVVAELRKKQKLWRRLAMKCPERYSHIIRY